MITVKEAIVVEGRYDKNTVSQIVDATIIETAGFGVFSDKEKISLLRRISEKRGLIILTDSDKPGFFIRGRLSGMLAGANVKHAYIPDVTGREKRKSAYSKERKLGVEGMAPEVILASLRRAGATFTEDSPSPERARGITKTDLYALGLSGRELSAANRRKLTLELGLPERLSANALLDVLNALFGREEFFEFFKNLDP